MPAIDDATLRGGKFVKERIPNGFAIHFEEAEDTSCIEDAGGDAVRLSSANPFTDPSIGLPLSVCETHDEGNADLLVRALNAWLERRKENR